VDNRSDRGRSTRNHERISYADHSAASTARSADARSPAAAPHAIDAIEVRITRHDLEPMLKRERADPDVILRDRRAVRAQGLTHERIVCGGLDADREDCRFADQRIEQERKAPTVPGAAEAVSVFARSRSRAAGVGRHRRARSSAQDSLRMRCYCTGVEEHSQSLGSTRRSSWMLRSTSHVDARFARPNTDRQPAVDVSPRRSAFFNASVTRIFIERPCSAARAFPRRSRSPTSSRVLLAMQPCHDEHGRIRSSPPVRGVHRPDRRRYGWPA
jgi:hypothetical protein